MTFSIENGGFSFDKKAKTPLLRELSFTAGPGDMLAILGPNGSGKTTLLRCACGFLRWDAGRSAIDGRDIRSIPARELWRKIAYVPQARSAASSCTVEESVMLGRGSHLGLLETPGQQDAQTVASVMEKLRISHLAKKKCSEISGGELQMALIARALASEPGVLILDEPESNLDFKNQLLVLETMAGLARAGMACVFNTHYPAHALRWANRALLLFPGGRSEFGKAGEIITGENIQKAFGVRAVIGEIQTDAGLLRDVLPVEISEDLQTP